MKYKIKDFRDEGDNKYVGFMVERDDGERFAIDKKVPLSEGKADDEYIDDAYKLAKDEIDDFLDNYVFSPVESEESKDESHLGKEWDISKKSFK
jgi:hypothetical protein